MSRSSSMQSGIIRYEPDELVVEVHAGTTMHDLAVTLADQGQRLRIPAVGTVGGAVAERRNGPYPSDNNALPNIVLRIRAVDGNGRAFTAGGGTVKNVSGFDLVKILVGSRGTLATITEVTFRTEPVPRASRWFEGSGSVDVLYRPALVALNRGRTIVNLEGHPDDVIEQSLLLHGFDEVQTPTPEEVIGFEPMEGPPRAVPATDSALAVCRRLKTAFDPHNVLAPERSRQLGLL